MKIKNTPARTILSLSALALLITGGLLYAGPLDPPTGPITSTYKTLTEVEPRTAINATNTPGDADSLFKITLPGSYYLTGNITGVVGKHGVEIAASGVTLDLNGFDLAGVAGSLDGVSVTVASLTNIAVLNGSVRNWGRDGIDLAEVIVVGCRVEGVRASGNVRIGIYGGRNSQVSRCSGSGGQYGILVRAGSTVSDCSATGTSITGLYVETGSTLTNCSANANAGTGISALDACTVTNCSATNNAANGIAVDRGGTVADCTARGNASTGIAAGDACTVLNSSASFNTGNGITTGNGCTVSNCSASSNFRGIVALYGSTVTNCSAHSNTGHGISTGTSCTVSNCSVAANTGSGISVSQGSTVADCTARANTLNGIVCDSSCIIRGNTCTVNGNGGGDGAGIRATLFDNRIEGNNCTDADRGIDVDLAGNIIIKNTCSGNATNWDIVANNVCGPILDRIAPASAAILGNSAPSSLGSTDPNANFSY